LVSIPGTKVNPDSIDEFHRGIELFNHGEYFECHEVLEEVWRHERGERRLFLQSLIHLAVAFYHHQQGNPAGMERQMQKGLKKLAGYLPEYCGVDTVQLYRDAIGVWEARCEKVLRFPAITLAARPATSLPPAHRS
jgi:predicted metal-dependent hydrolase